LWGATAETTVKLLLKESEGKTCLFLRRKSLRKRGPSWGGGPQGLVSIPYIRQREGICWGKKRYNFSSRRGRGKVEQTKLR